MGVPVVKSPNGFGLPVTVVSSGGLPIEVASNGYGTPIIEVPSGGLPVCYVGGSGASSAFYSSAAKILAMSQNPQSAVVDAALSVDVSNTGNSTINGKTLAAGGIIVNASVPNGISPPLDPGVKWIVSKTPANQTSANLTYAPGQQKLFKFSGQKFDFKAGNGAGVNFSVYWSEDNGFNWKRAGPFTITQACWCLVDFGSAMNRVVKIIGEDEQFQMYGFNFDTGPSIPAAYDTSAFPKGMVFGDSYMFGQGAGIASKGVGLETARLLGWHQIYTHGFRTNGFSQTQGGVQSRFADRIKLPTDDTLSEGAHWGPVEYVLMNASINDDGATWNATRYQDHVDAFTRMREKQPYALIVFAIGMRPPDYGANPYTDAKAAFKAVFGNTPAEWIANGAYLLDGSIATGEAWVPLGAVGSSPYFPASGDTAHPNAAGHAFLGAKYAAALISLATSIVNSSTGPTDSLRITSTGDVRVTADGNTRKVA